jgi:hypothetical protein
MAKCREIVSLALRKLGVLASGRDPRPTDATDALEALQSLYGFWVASGAFGRLEDVQPIGPEYTARIGQRVTRESADLVTVNLPDQVIYNDAVFIRDYGFDRGPLYTQPRDASAVVIVSLDTGNLQTWLYDGTAKKWQECELLQMDDEAPRSQADRHGLAACLAERISDQFGMEVPTQTVMQAGAYKTALTTRYGFQDQVGYRPGSYM